MKDPTEPAPAATGWRRLRGRRLLIVVFLLSLAQIPLLSLVSPTFVRGDGVGYYAYLRSVVFDHDLDFRNEYSHFVDRLPAAERSLTARFLENPTAAGMVPNHWPPGTAILWSPFFILAHGAVLLANGCGGTFAVDGFSMPYQVSVAIASALYGFGGLLLLFATARRLFPDGPSTTAVLTMWFATPLTAYMYFMASMSHGCSFFAVSLFIYLWQKDRGSLRLSRAIVLGLSAGLVMLHRLQNVVFLVPLAYELLVDWRHRANSNPRVWRQTARFSVATGLALIVALIPQFLLWRILYGDRWMPPYSGYFNFLDPHVMRVLFSANHGLFTWTPVVAIGLLGFGRLRRRDRLLADGLLLVFLAQLYIVSCFSIWHGDAAFGARYFIDCIPLFGLGLAALLDGMRRGWPRIGLTLTCAALAAWNYLLLFQYGTGMIPRSGAVAFGEVARNAFLVIPVRVLEKLLNSPSL